MKKKEPINAFELLWGYAWLYGFAVSKLGRKEVNNKLKELNNRFYIPTKKSRRLKNE